MRGQKPGRTAVFAAQDSGVRVRRMFEFLREHPVGVISSVTPDGNPHGAVVYLAADETLTVRFLTKKRTRKYDNLKHNSRVMLTVYDARTQTVLQLTGIALEHDGLAVMNEVAAAVFRVPLATGAGGLPPIAKLQAGAFTTFCIEPLEVRMAVYARLETGDYNQLFESVESFELPEV